MKILFLDTNIFLQCRDLADLPWDEVAESESLLLLISRPVQEEIDHLKHDRNSRRAKRARKASSFMRQIILAKDTKVSIRESAPRVEISFPPLLNIQGNPPVILDLSRADDQIIAEAFAYKTAYPNADVAILTHDTNPILTAKRCSLPYVMIPDDWLLPPEPDIRDKKIEELERRLKELEKSNPLIEIISQDAGGSRLDSLPIMVQCYKMLTEAEIKALVTEAQTQHPFVARFDGPEKKPSPPHTGLEASYHVFGGIAHRYQAPSEKEIQEYRRLYPKWLNKIREFFTALHTELEMPSRYVDLSILISNKGSVPAENVVVEFEALGGFLLMAPIQGDDNQDTEQRPNKLPPPPPVPKGKWITEKSPFSSLLDSFQRIEQFAKPTHDLPMYFPLLKEERSRDKHAFYWKHGRLSKYTDSWTLECEEFRHQVAPEIFGVVIFIPPKSNSEKGALRCRVTAKNLPRPVEYILPISVKYVQDDIVSKARSLLEQSES